MAYFPNGVSGEVLDRQCADCPLGFGWDNPQQMDLPGMPAREPRGACPTFLVQMIFNYKQCNDKNKDLKNAMNLLVEESGICQTRKELVELRKKGISDGSQGCTDT